MDEEQGDVMRNLATRPKHRCMGKLAVALLICCLPAVALAQSQPADEDCLACHEGLDAGLKNTAHQLSSQLKGPKVRIECASCHEGAATHIEDPSAANIVNPGKAAKSKTESICTECHAGHMNLDNIGFDPHSEQGISCAACHSVHSGSQGHLRDNNFQFCGSCHVSLTASMNTRSAHPLADGNISCVSCHDFKNQNQPLVGFGRSANCAECHAEQSGPFVWEHEAASSVTPESDGCVACHNPHGSPNDRLLVQPGEALCKQCHGVPPLHQTFHGGIGSQFGCVECHSEVHGSNHNKGLLDPDLGSKIDVGPAGCFCHDVEG